MKKEINSSFAVVLAAGWLCPEFCRAEDQPNIVFIHLDDLNFDEIGCYPQGAGRVLTPNRSLIMKTVSKPRLFKIAGLGLAVAGLTSLNCRAEQGSVKPNILLIMADDLGYADVSFTGGKDIPTPNIDRIAKEGIFLSQFYVTCPYCAPSRAAVLTGRYQQRFGMDNNPRDGSAEDGIGAGEVLLPVQLKAAGYRTGLVGKWHLGAGEEHHPNRRGFDEFFGTVHGGHQYVPVDPMRLSEHWRFYADNLQRNGVKAVHDRYVTDQFTDEAVRFISESAGCPFFLFLSYNAPHTPLQAPPELEAGFVHLKDPKRITYAAMVRSLDNGVGRVLTQLDQAGLSENTMVIFMSDNGGRTDSGASNAPYKGRKGDPLEGGVRVPFAMRWPGKIRPGSVSGEMVSALDLFPTLAAAGAQLPAGVDLDGFNLDPVLRSGSWGTPPRDRLFWRQLSGDRVVKAVRLNGWKWGVTRHKAEFLHEIDSDPFEKNNRLKDLPEQAEELRKEFENWSQQVGMPRWTGGE